MHRKRFTLALLIATGLGGCAMAADRGPSALPTEGFVSSDGLRIRYQRSGAGPPLVLVHGWGSTAHSNWVATGWVALLAPRRTVIAIDVRGHGRSDKPHARAPYSYAAMSRDVLAVLDAHGIERADFVGYSMGAFMGAWLLGHHPDRFRRMVLGGIGDETPASAAQGDAIAEALRAPELTAVTDPAARAVRRFVERGEPVDLIALAYSAEQMWPEGYPLTVAGPGVGAAAVPVLVVNGTDDHPYVDTADRFVEALADGCHLTLPGRDHLTAVADPQFKAAVIEFLEEGAESGTVP